jgi:hypothetical protein
VIARIGILEKIEKHIEILNRIALYLLKHDKSESPDSLDSLLILASQKMRPTIVQAILRKNLTSLNGKYQALLAAIGTPGRSTYTEYKTIRSDIVSSLIQSGLDINYNNNEPLKEAIRNAAVDVINNLLARNAKTEDENFDALGLAFMIAEEKINEGKLDRIETLQKFLRHDLDRIENKIGKIKELENKYSTWSNEISEISLDNLKNGKSMRNPQELQKLIGEAKELYRMMQNEMTPFSQNISRKRGFETLYKFL